MADLDFKPFINWEGLRKAVATATRFLDRVIDTTTYLHPNFEKMSKETRPIGLGLMGFADVLIKLGISYGSQESIELFERICFEINYTAISESINLAKEYGGIIIRDEDKSHFQQLLRYYTKDDDTILKRFYQHGIRNSNWTCIAPTGSISMSADVSYAWEPLMAIVWEKPLVDSDKVLKIIHPQFEKDFNILIKQHDWDDTTRNKIINEIVENKGSIQNLSYFPQSMKDIYKVAHDINPFDKIKMQGKGQKYISLAISSTCNLPNSATIEDVAAIYRHAYKCNLKGITIFRDGCLDSGQVVNFGKIEKEKKVDEIKRPIKRAGETVEIPTPYGKLYVTCNFNSTMPFEIFFRVGKQGALTNVLIDALGRVCSKALQGGIPMDSIVDTLRGLKGEKFWFKIADDINKTESAESIVDAISKLIEYHWTEMPLNSTCIQDNCELEECPQCHRKTLRRDTGCRGGMCLVCGHSACG
jgi:ribonucleoside-diphosphate reductase alpha chain